MSDAPKAESDHGKQLPWETGSQQGSESVLCFPFISKTRRDQELNYKGNKQLTLQGKAEAIKLHFHLQVLIPFETQKPLLHVAKWITAIQSFF